MRHPKALMGPGLCLHSHPAHRLTTVNARQLTQGDRLSPDDIRENHELGDQDVHRRASDP